MDDLQDVHAGGKRKYKENPLTAKAETGSLKIKIMRKGEVLQSNGLSLRGALDGYAFTGVPRSPPAAPAPPPQPIPSPPKPRANRKHVPIFYQRPNAFDMSASTSTDENFSQTQSMTSDYELSLSASATSSSSTTGRFSRLEIAPGLPGSLQDPMPLTNPLFTRGMSETSGSLTDLLRTVLPTVPPMESTGHSYDDYSNDTTSTTSEQMRSSSSQPGLMNPAAALRQLASSSAAYASHTRETTLLPSIQMHQAMHRYSTQPHPPDTHASDHPDDYANEYHTKHHQQHEAVATSETEEHHQKEEEEETIQPNYRFDAMSALQNAVKIAVASTSPMTTQPPSSRWPPPDNDDNDLGPPPSGPPGLSIQHSLMGGGIEAQPVIPTINTVNFNWHRYQQEQAARPRTNPPTSSIASGAADDIKDTSKKSSSAVH